MRIPADQYHAIDIEAGSWRLTANGSTPESLLVEAREGVPLRYTAAFGSPRHLPAPGGYALAEIPLDDVQRVVVGWSESDGGWHLGLLLQGALAERRGSRWCELAAWNDPTAIAHRGNAEHAGQALAARIGRPFALIPPKLAPSASAVSAQRGFADEASSATLHPMTDARAVTNAPVTGAPAVGASAITLPLTLGGWQLERQGDAQLTWTRAAHWQRSRLLRAAWYLLWSGIAVALATLSLTAGIAPTQPEFLPYLGYAAALILLISAAYSLVTAFTRVSRIEVDGAARRVHGLRGAREVWSLDAQAVEYLYVTEIVGKASERRETRPLSEVEFSALLQASDAAGKFQPLLRVTGLEEKIPRAAFESIEQANAEAVMTLTPDLAHSPAQMAGLLMAQALGVAARYDRRIK